MSSNNGNDVDDDAAAVLSSRNKEDPINGRCGKVPERPREEFPTKHR
jgi:hypothetical protein